MRALTVEELGFVSGGTGAVETIVVWGIRMSCRGASGASGGGGGGGQHQPPQFDNTAASDDVPNFLDFLTPTDIDGILAVGFLAGAIPFAAGAATTAGLVIGAITLTPFVCAVIAAGIALTGAAVVLTRVQARKTY